MTKENFAQESDDSAPEEEEAPEKRSTVIILARTHPTEANTSFIVQGQMKKKMNFQICFSNDFVTGMMEFLTSTHKIAKDLRKNLDFIIFPMINPDGVFLGNTR